MSLMLTGSAATEAMGAALARVLRPGDAVALHGDLGTGKTTLVRGLLGGLGFDGDVPSPSFPIVIAYDPPDVTIPVWHVDLYRIDDPADLPELGLDDARLDGVLLIEWPERMGAHLWDDSLHLTLDRVDEGARRLTWAVPAAWEGRWPPR